MDGYECQGFSFYSNFDSANLLRVEAVLKNNENDTPQATISGKTEIVDYEFNLWTKPDCAGTEFENGNRTWFYFALKTPQPLVYTKFNITDINKQAKLFGQGMVPVYRMVPGKQNWDRISEKPTFTTEDVFTLSFKFRMPENINTIIYFAFTYPYSFHDLQNKLDVVDKKWIKQEEIDTLDDIYYVRENVCRTVQNRRVDLLTITSYHGITEQRETRLRNLFPDALATPRPYKFDAKKVIFLSARVHPGETPSSFVLNGFINLILTREDHIAQLLRRMYVFKIIPCLNPDGVVNGHYRTDTRGVNLNRVYLSPSVTDHPTIYAARSLIRYYHYGYERDTDEIEPGVTATSDENILTEVGEITLEEKNKKNKVLCVKCRGKLLTVEETPRIKTTTPIYCVNCGECLQSVESGLFLYLDMHGHASKKGIFMYGNHFDDLESNVRCMVLPKLMSLNNHNFHFTACNFTEKNMYLKDKRDGMSREGSGRVAVFKLTGLIQSYTLECNYNTGRLVNVLPACIKEQSMRSMPNVVVPPKYTPNIFEEVGRALGASILDLTGNNPYTRMPHSEYHTLNGLREWLRIHCTYNLGDTRKMPKRLKLRQAASLHAQGKTVRPVLKTRSFPTKYHPKKPNLKQRQPKAAKRDKEVVSPQPSCSYNYNNVPSSSSSSGGGGGKTKRKPALNMNAKAHLGNAGDKERASIKRPSINYIAKNIRNTSPNLIKTNREAAPTAERNADKVKVKEICYVKGVNGKRVIATYERNNKVEAENLIVAWDASNTRPQVFTHKSRMPAFLNRRNNGDGEPRQRNYRVHNFQKSNQTAATYSKIKLSKRNLRTHSTAESPNKSKTAKAKNKAKKKKRKDLA